MTDAKMTWRYAVTLEPNVSIGPRRFVRVIEVAGPRPFVALMEAIKLFEAEETHVWQSNDVSLRIERVA